ncbi:hypothetical protein [Tuwongella immobilis]|uniref:Uncharacterized protein n=1 Tax=Tuwongella immobilis TaxID=692036 RepID=A0A6C2YSR1_9BACT|nr:hypothetical protein [Tuwongella immobilis]VIP04750.1 unnamed protein product [Tuwongella immobilis]VTS06859.1 unnamed protein product [Tuwongella immobilis]
MTIRSAIGTIAAFTAMLAAIGGSIGWALGTYAPGYYRSVFRNGNEPWFDPVDVGLGQGLTQGTTGGVVVGLIVVALFIWRDTRGSRESVAPSPANPTAPSHGPTVPISLTIAGLFAPWLMLVVGIAGLMMVPDPRAAIGVWYLLLIVCMVVILVQMVAGIWSMVRNAPRRRSAWAWAFLVGCNANLILLSKLGGH